MYMQQRYYDPVAARFMSLDPVTTDANTGGSFNRYNYANNNPYRFVDFEGREPSDPANRSEYGLPPLPQPGPAPTPTPEPTPDCGCTKFDKVTVIGIAVPPGLRAQWLAWTLAEIAGRRIAQSVLQSVGVKSDPNVYAKPPKQSGLGEQKPDNAPPGTLGACRT